MHATFTVDWVAHGSSNGWLSQYKLHTLFSDAYHFRALAVNMAPGAASF
jgi:hypothetical protein